MSKKSLIGFVFILVFLSAAAYFYNASKKHEVIIIPPTVVPNNDTPYLLGENDTYKVEVQDEYKIDSNIPTDIMVTSKLDGSKFIIPQVTGWSLGVIVKNNTDKNLILFSLGTSSTREALIYDVTLKKQLASFCHIGGPVFWGNYFIYEDCTTSKALNIKTFDVEGGENAPVIYKLDPRTGIKTILIKSDDLHTYRIDWKNKLSDSDSMIKLRVTSVSKLGDWSDLSKWKEGEKLIKL